MKWTKVALWQGFSASTQYPDGKYQGEVRQGLNGDGKPGTDIWQSYVKTFVCTESPLPPNLGMQAETPDQPHQQNILSPSRADHQCRCQSNNSEIFLTQPAEVFTSDQPPPPPQLIYVGMNEVQWHFWRFFLHFPFPATKTIYKFMLRLQDQSFKPGNMRFKVVCGIYIFMTCYVS